MSAYLILENGMVFEGEYFGAKGEVIGEIVFTTGMSGYLETLTDPSYYGQIILQTFPLIGNYGVIPSDFESARCSAKAFIAKYPCQDPSNFRSEGDLDTFLKSEGVVGLKGIDTRALTRIIRKNGVMNGKITSTPPTESDREEAASHSVSSAVPSVSTKEVTKEGQGAKRKIALLDFGAKRGMTKALLERDCEVWTFPYNSSAKDILAINPDGIMLSNGPGDPKDSANSIIIETLKELMKTDVTIFGICLGHQFLAVANGFTTEKMKFGHRGENQPVKDLETGRVYITSQNHGYTVVADKENCSFINVNDGTCEGIDYGKSFSVQFHPEACGGPLDTSFIFDRFIERIDNNAAK